MSDTDWIIVFQNFLDFQQEENLEDHHKVAFDLTAWRIVLDTAKRPYEAREFLNSILPEKYRQTA